MSKAIFISCLNFRTLVIFEQLENETGLPLITGKQHFNCHLEQDPCHDQSERSLETRYKRRQVIKFTGAQID